MTRLKSLITDPSFHAKWERAKFYADIAFILTATAGLVGLVLTFAAKDKVIYWSKDKLQSNRTSYE